MSLSVFLNQPDKWATHDADVKGAIKFASGIRLFTEKAANTGAQHSIKARLSKVWDVNGTFTAVCLCAYTYRILNV